MERLIIEQLDQHGKNVKRRYIFEKGQATVGRSFSNDMILGDPFVSPRHLAIAARDGKIFVKDLASENGADIGKGEILKDQTVKFASGDEICIGGTKLKLYLGSHPVGPARHLDKLLTIGKIFDRWPVAIGLSLMALSVTVWASYMEMPSGKFWEEEFYGVVIGYFSTAFFYTLLAGYIIYLKINKAYFRRHLAISNIGTLVSAFYVFINPAIFFWIFHEGLLTFLNRAIFFGIILAMLWASIKLTKEFVNKRDFAGVLMITLTLTLLTAWSQKEIQQEFSEKPSFPAIMAPYLKPISEPAPINDFLKEAGEELFRPRK